MSNILSLSFEPAQIPARITVGKIAKVCVLLPYMKALTDTPGSANSLNVLNAAGFVVPDAAPTIAFQGTGLTGGPYAYYITFYDENTDTESNPSAQSSSLSPSNQGIRVTNAATNNASNSRVTHWRIYRNVTGGSTYFRVATVAIATTTYDDTASDASISGNDPLQLDNTAPVVETYGFIKTFRNFALMGGPHNGRGGTNYDHRITWCKVGNIDAWPTLNETDFAPGQYGVIRNMEPAGPAMLVYKDSCIIRWIWRTDPSGIYGDGDNDVVNTLRGCINDRCVANVQGTHFVMDPEGVYATRDGATIDEISYELDTVWARINWRQRHKFSATWDQRHVWFAVALDEDEECRYLFVLDLLKVKAREGQCWAVEEYDWGWRDLCRMDCGKNTASTLYGMERKVVPAGIDERGRVHILSLGWRDGVSPELTAEAVVASSGSTTTVVKAASGTFTATNADGKTVDVKDMYLRFRDIPAGVNKVTDQDWKRAYRVTAISGTELTVTPAMPAAPPAGTRFFVGARPNAVLRTPQMTFGAPDKLKRLVVTRLEAQPGGMPIDMRLRMSADRMGWIEMGTTSEATQSHYTTEAGNPDITVKLGGNFTEYARRGVVEIAGSAYRAYCWQIELDATGPDRPIVIDALDFEVELQEA